MELGAITLNCRAQRHSEAFAAVSGRALGCQGCATKVQWGKKMLKL